METATDIYRHARRHGATISQAARKAGLDFDRAMRIEGRRFCVACGDYVRDIDCAHWDYETLGG